MIPDTIIKISEVEIKNVPREFFNPKEYSLIELIGKKIIYRGENYKIFETGTVCHGERNDCVIVNWDDNTQPTTIYNDHNFCQLGVEILEKCTLY